MLKRRRSFDIAKYYKLTAYLKTKIVGFVQKNRKFSGKEKWPIFPDDIYLIVQLATLFGFAGARRWDELTRRKRYALVSKGP